MEKKSENGALNEEQGLRILKPVKMGVRVVPTKVFNTPEEFSKEESHKKEEKSEGKEEMTEARKRQVHKKAASLSRLNDLPEIQIELSSPPGSAERKPTSNKTEPSIRGTVYQSFKGYIKKLTEKAPTLVATADHAFESLDVYDTVDAVENDDNIFSSPYVVTHEKWYKRCWNFVYMESWIFLLLLGVTSALTIILIDFMFVRLDALKLLVKDKISNTALSFFLWILLSAAFSAVGSGCVYFISPHSAGSGLPEMKSVISGVNMKHYLSFRTIVAKMWGLAFCYASSLSIGRTGPYSHICSAIATQLMEIKGFEKLKENAGQKLQLIACACSVALSIGMGAPIGGVLFAIEVTSSFFNMKSLWKCFYCTMCGVLTVRLLG